MPTSKFWPHRDDELRALVSDPNMTSAAKIGRAMDIREATVASRIARLGLRANKVVVVKLPRDREGQLIRGLVTLPPLPCLQVPLYVVQGK